MGWKPPRKEPEGDESEEKEVIEPNGHDLTEKRQRQQHSREWSVGTWEAIAKELHDMQRNQKYVTEPKRRRGNASGN